MVNAEGFWHGEDKSSLNLTYAWMPANRWVVNSEKILTMNFGSFNRSVVSCRSEGSACEYCSLKTKKSSPS
jgi:hypothetical protein